MKPTFLAPILLAGTLAVGCAALPAAAGGPARDDDLTDANPPSKQASSGAGSSTKLDLGDVRPGDDIRVDVPSDALGFNIVVNGDPGASVGIASLVSPSGKAVVSGYVPTGSRSTDGIGSRGIAAFSVPMTNDTATAPLETGSWHLVASGIVVDPNAPIDKSGKVLPRGDELNELSPLHVTVTIQRSGDGEFHGGVLDMHVYVPEGLHVHDPEPDHEITAATALADRSIASRIDVFYKELDRLFGVGRGTIAFHPIAASFLSATTGDERAAIIAQATAPSKQALHVVLTNKVSYTDGPPLLGYSVGMPGAANMTSTVRSAILVGLYDDSSATNDAVTLLHEMGHFVGLMHTTDDDGTPDLLEDTPTCSEKKRTLCADVENLMTPTGPLHQTEVTPSQVRVVRGSSIYRATTKG